MWKTRVGAQEMRMMKKKQILKVNNFNIIKKINKILENNFITW